MDRVRIGGLMRCCILTLETRNVPAYEGERIECVHCAGGIVFRAGAWEWEGASGGLTSKC